MMRGVLVAAVSTIVLFVLAVAFEPSSCADYPDGRRCDEVVYLLLALAGAALATTLGLTVRTVLRTRRRNRPEAYDHA